MHVALARLGKRGEKCSSVVVVRETFRAAVQVRADFGHTLRRELLIEIIPELLDRSAAVYVARTFSHACFRVGRAARC